MILSFKGRAKLTNSNVTPFKVELKADCENCFALCCVALPFMKSADFAFNKDEGMPCKHLKDDYRCGIHQHLKHSGFSGCVSFDCFGAGQWVSQKTYGGISWKDRPSIAQEMFEVFPIMQQLHEMLYYLTDALMRPETQSIHGKLKDLIKSTEQFAELHAQQILDIDLNEHRKHVNHLLTISSKIVRDQVGLLHKKWINIKNVIEKKTDLIGMNFKGGDLRGSNFRGKLLIGANLSKCNLTYSDFIGADLRQANVKGANLMGSIFLTQAQINAANGDGHTLLPQHLKKPKHWEV